jgi:hypothetical protein
VHGRLFVENVLNGYDRITEYAATNKPDYFTKARERLQTELTKRNKCKPSQQEVTEELLHSSLKQIAATDKNVDKQSNSYEYNWRIKQNLFDKYDPQRHGKQVVLPELKKPDGSDDPFFVNAFYHRGNDAKGEPRDALIPKDLKLYRAITKEEALENKKKGNPDFTVPFVEVPYEQRVVGNGDIVFEILEIVGFDRKNCGNETTCKGIIWLCKKEDFNSNEQPLPSNLGICPSSYFVHAKPYPYTKHRDIQQEVKDAEIKKKAEEEAKKKLAAAEEEEANKKNH